MKRHHSLFVGLLLVCATNAQSQSRWNESILGTLSPHDAALPTPRAQKTVVQDFSHLPLSFERNLGQTDSRVRFLTHTADSTLFLTPSEAVFNLAAQPSHRFRERGVSGKDRKVRPSVRKSARVALRMQMAGANPRATTLEQQPLAGRVNYFLGQDPGNWRAGVPTFGRVGFHGVYPGVDLVYYGNQRHLEYDFVVAPHADPKQIHLRFAGAQRLLVSAAGDLSVRVKGQELRWQKPTVYQQDATGKHSIATRFRLKRLPNGQKDVSFALGRYDTSRPLVIDPVLLYSTFLGDETVEPYASGIAVDSLGSAYVTGTASAPDFPTTSGAYQTTGIGAAFVTKVDPAGATLVYSTYLGGTGGDAPKGVAVDKNGNAYVAGFTRSTDFPTTAGALQPRYMQNGGGDPRGVAFVTKLNPTGSALAYSTYLGGYNLDVAFAIAVDSSGDAFVCGETFASNFPTTPNAFQRGIHGNGGSNAFVSKLNPTGTALLYSTYLGGSGSGDPTSDRDKAFALAIDNVGNAYVTGYTDSYDFPTTPGVLQPTNPAIGTPVRTSKVFVTQLNSNGTALVYSTFLGGASGIDGGAGIAVDGVGNAYITGQTDSTDFPLTPGAYQTTHPSMFVAKLNSTASGLLYSTFLGRSASTTEYARGIVIDGTGNAYVTGYTDSAVYPTTLGAVQRTKAPSVHETGFLTKLNASGTGLLYSTYLGGTGASSLMGDYPLAIARDSNDAIYITGMAFSRDYPTTPGAFRTTSQVTPGRSTAFVTKLSAVSSFPDFNNDNNTDLFLQNPSTGAIASWFMQGKAKAGGVAFSLSPPTEYALVGAGDFNRDGNTTLVLQSNVSNQVVFWYTSGTNHATISGGDFITTIPASGWKVVGVGEFNGDGKSDLVFQNQTTNQVAIWYMNGAKYQGGVLLPFTPLAGWKAVGTGDFNGDGFTDVVFQNQTSNQLALWYLKGATYLDGVVLTAAPAAGWKVVGVGDYNGDGSADLLFQNPASSLAAIWFLQNGNFIGGDVLSNAIPTGFKIVGPR